MKPLIRTAAAFSALLLAGSLTACGSSSSNSSTSAASTPKASSSVKALTAPNSSAPFYAALPDEVKKAGKLNLGSEIGYPPMEYYDTDGKTILGFDKTLSDLLSNQLGVPIEWSNSNFDGLITQLQSKRVDMVMASMMDNKTREEKVDFVDYYSENSVILVKSGNPDKLTSVEDLCGKTVGVQRGTTQEDALTTQNKKCTDGGKAAITVLAFDKESDALLQVKQGRAAATVEQNAVAAYNKTQGKGAYEIVPGVIPGTASPVGIAVSKDNTALRDAVNKAMAALMSNGQYQQAIEQYGLTEGKLSAPTVNGAAK